MRYSFEYPFPSPDCCGPMSVLRGRCFLRFFFVFDGQKSRCIISLGDPAISACRWSFSRFMSSSLELLRSWSEGKGSRWSDGGLSRWPDGGLSRSSDGGLSRSDGGGLSRSSDGGLSRSSDGGLSRGSDVRWSRWSVFRVGGSANSGRRLFGRLVVNATQVDSASKTCLW